MSARFINNAIRDDGLNYVGAQTGLVQHFFDVYTDDRATIIATSLANVALSAGDVPVGDDGGGGRQITVAAKSNITPTGSGTINHVAIISDTETLTVADSTGLAVTPSNDFNSNSYPVQFEATKQL